MNKENIVNLLNTIFKKDAIANAIASVTGQKLDNIEIEVNKIYNNLFLTTSDSDGLKNFENELEITFSKNQSLKDRKAIISAKWRGAGTLTLELIQQTVDAYTEEDVIVRFDTVIILDFTNDIGKPDNLEALKKQLEEVIPAHLGIEYIFRYRTWGELEPYKYMNIATDTWQNVKENANIGIKENKIKNRTKRDILQSNNIYYPKKTDYVDIDVLNNNTKILDEKKLEKSDLSDIAKENTSQRIEDKVSGLESKLNSSLSGVAKERSAYNIENKVDSLESKLNSGLSGVAKENTSNQILTGVSNIKNVVNSSLNGVAKERSTYNIENKVNSLESKLSSLESKLNSLSNNIKPSGVKAVYRGSSSIYNGQFVVVNLYEDVNFSKALLFASGTNLDSNNELQFGSIAIEPSGVGKIAVKVNTSSNKNIERLIFSWQVIEFY